MASSYSYKPSRYGTAAIGKYNHAQAQKHQLKLYTQDTKIAQQHYAALKKATTDWQPGNKGKVESVEQESANCFMCADTHRLMGDFHTERAMAYMEAARLHTQLGLLVAKQKGTMEKADPANNHAKAPTMFDVHPNSDDHDHDKAYDFHTSLHADARMEAAEYLRIAESLNEMLQTGNESDQMSIKEAMAVCKEMYQCHNSIAELHSLYASNINTILNRRAYAAFGHPDYPDGGYTHEPAMASAPLG